MAEVRTRSPDIDVDDIEGTFGKSEFLDYIGTKLHMSVGTSHRSFHVFLDEEDDESHSYQTLFFRVSPSSIPPPVVKDKIRIALQHVDLFFNRAMLVQFWVPVTIGGRRFLTCSYQPFGLTYLRKGLCSYRKLCLNRYYCTNNSSSDDAVDYVDVDWIGGGVIQSVLLTGPPSRAFLQGLPEYSPNVEFYSGSEYPLRDAAMDRKVNDYMAVPVFQPNSPECIGVIEVVSTAESMKEMDVPAYVFGLISTALQGVELRTSNFAGHFYMENELANNSTDISHALCEIRRALDEACQRHNLPFAQTWMPRLGKNQSYTDNALSTTRNEYYLSHPRFSLFRDICESLQLSRGRGVVWNSFFSGRPCFCRDITKLSIAEYSFAHVGKKALLHSSFAICLKSDHTGNDLYVLELFLPSGTADPGELLEPVLLTMKEHLNSFRLASGAILGDEMTVEVLRVSKEDELDSFSLFHTTGGSKVLAMTQEDKANIYDLFLLEDTPFSITSLGTRDDVFGWKEDSRDTPSVKAGNSSIISSASTSRFPEQDSSIGLAAEDTRFNPLPNPDVDSSANKEGTSSTSNLHKLDFETVEKYFGLTLKDAAENLHVSPSTLKRRCREFGIGSWPGKRATCTESHRDRKKVKAEYGQDVSHPCVSSQEGTITSKHNSSQPATMAKDSFMMIKAAYGEIKKIKFQLPFSSQLVDMEMEAASRLGLERGHFTLWYLDEEDDWIMITRDADLRTMESTGKNTFKVSITHGNDAPSYS